MVAVRSPGMAEAPEPSPAARAPGGGL